MLKLRILISYHYFKQYDLNEQYKKYFTLPYPDTLLDSGAWSAFTQKVDVDLNQYIEFVHKYKKLFTIYMNLDDMLDPAKTLENQTIMEQNGLQPIPVFHTGEPWHYLEGYCERYPYVALGKIIPYTSNKKVIIPWIVKAFKIAKKYKAVFHGLGATNWTLIKSFPWYSVDSSSWGSGYRFGNVPVFDPHRGVFLKLPLGDPAAWSRHSR